MKQLPPWLCIPQDSHTKDDSLYDDCIEAEQQAIVSYLLALESFYCDASSQYDKVQDKARKIWDDGHPIRAEYLRLAHEMTIIRREIWSLMQDVPRYRDWVCPVTMPWIHSQVQYIYPNLSEK